MFTRLRRTKNHRVHTVFKQPLNTIQVKDQRVLLHIQQKIGEDMKRRIKENHIIKLNK